MGRILVDGEPGNDIVPACAARPGETVIVKPGKGAFWATPLDGLLRGQGIYAPPPMASPPRCACRPPWRGANDRGYECLLVEDATESYFAALKAVTLEMVRAQAAIVG